VNAIEAKRKAKENRNSEAQKQNESPDGNHNSEGGIQGETGTAEKEDSPAASGDARDR